MNVITEKPNLYDLDLDQLTALFAQLGQPRYRAVQVWQWLYQHLATDFEQMTSLSKSLRESLQMAVRLETPRVLARQESMDGETRKDLLAFPDGEQVEVVLMRYIDRRSACLSTQTGCALGCAFCATGQMGLHRNLSSGEIVVQALHLARELQAQEQRLSHIVLMGMGEPFLNYDATLAAIRRLIDPGGFGMGQRRITVSTSGIIPGIERFANEGIQANLAVSLHAATDAVRSQIMPVNQRYRLDDLFTAVQGYIDKTNRRVTFEYIFIEGVNDTPEQATALATRLTGMLAHVNFIPLNPTDGYAGRPSTPEQITRFTQVMDRYRIPYTVRLRRGTDISAGCGQLRARMK